MTNTRKFNIFMETGDLYTGELNYFWTHSKGITTFNLNIFSLSVAGNLHLSSEIGKVEDIIKSYIDTKLEQDFEWLSKNLNITIDNRPDVATSCERV